MRTIPEKRNIAFLAFSFIVAISAYLKPLTSDDFCMAMISGTDQRISSVVDAFKSANIIYMGWSGAYFTQFFTGLYTYLPQVAMYFTVAISIFITLYFIQKISNTKANAIVVIFLFLVLCPAKEEVLYWKMGFFAYAFACPFFLAFIYYYHKGQSKYLFFLALISGIWHFPAIIPISGALFFDLLFNFKQRSTLQKSMAVAFWCGSLIVLLSPGTFNRTSSEMAESSHDFAFYLNVLLKSFLSIASLWVLVVVLIIKKKNIKTFYLEYAFLNNCMLISLIFYLLLGFVVEFPAQRYFLCFHIFCDIVVLSELSSMSFISNSKWLNSSLALAAIAILVIDIHAHIKEHKQFCYEEEIIKNSNGGVIPLDLIYASDDSLYWANKALTKYYRVSPFSALPSDLYYGLYLNNKNNKVKRFNEEGWYVISNKFFFKEIGDVKCINRLHPNWVKAYDFPLIGCLRSNTYPSYRIFSSKNGNIYILLTNGKERTKVLEIFE